MPAPLSCGEPPELTLLVNECELVTYCANDERVDGRRCDQTVQCADQSDELGCFEETGHDWFWCDPQLFRASDICRDTSCALEKTPPVCDPGRPERYLCDDGSDVDVYVVCDRSADCPDGSDERYCVK